MNYTSALFYILLLLSTACTSSKPDLKNLSKNGEVILSMERTPCYGRCPVYDLQLYQNGLLVYHAKKFTTQTGCSYTSLSKQEINEVKEKFTKADFFKMAALYPENGKTPTDLPSCILYFKNGTEQKKITDHRWQTPETLTRLEQTVDSLVTGKKLQNCDK